MRPELSRQTFLLATPGAEGFTRPRPFRPGVEGPNRSFADHNRLTGSITLFCGKDEDVSPGDVLVPPGASDFSRPMYFVLSVRDYPAHREAMACAVPPDQFP